MKYKNVDDYIADAPVKVRGDLEILRKVIKEVAPQALEKISYSMPFYEYKGRLVYFAFYKKHIGLYVPPPIIDSYKDELKEYKVSKSAVQFPIGQKLPVQIIKKLIKARIEWNSSLH